MHLLTKLIHTHTYRLIANAPYIAPPHTHTHVQAYSQCTVHSPPPPPHTHTRTGLANALYIAPPPPPTHTHVQA